MGHEAGVFSVSFSKDGQTLATASQDKTAKLWSLDGRELQTLRGHTDTVTRVRFSPEDQSVVSTSADDTIRFWSLDGELLQTLTGHTGWVWDAAFSPDGQTFATASADPDRSVKLWRRNPNQIQAHQAPISRVSFSPDGRILATASDDGTVKLWDQEGQRQHIFRDRTRCHHSRRYRGLG